MDLERQKCTLAGGVRVGSMLTSVRDNCVTNLFQSSEYSGSDSCTAILTGGRSKCEKCTTATSNAERSRCHSHFFRASMPFPYVIAIVALPFTDPLCLKVVLFLPAVWSAMFRSAHPHSSTEEYSCLTSWSTYVSKQAPALDRDPW